MARSGKRVRPEVATGGSTENGRLKKEEIGGIGCPEENLLGLEPHNGEKLLEALHSPWFASDFGLSKCHCRTSLSAVQKSKFL
jgi:hypothetical protein